MGVLYQLGSASEIDLRTTTLDGKTGDVGKVPHSALFKPNRSVSCKDCPGRDRKHPLRTPHGALLMTKRIYLSPPSVAEDDIEAVEAAMRSGWVAPVGPDLTGFEGDICEFTGAKNAVALSSGTAAIHLGLRALGVDPGDSVLCPTLTFGATAFAIVHAGARPIFVDSERTSWNMDPEIVGDVLSNLAGEGRLPTAIVAVDIFGRTCNYEALLEVAYRYEIPVLVDSAESLGATHQGKSAGTMGALGIYSFNGNKILTTSGGGMLVSDDPAIVERVRFWSTQSREDFPWYEHNEIGYNFRLSNILAALGRSQLRRLPEMIEKRRMINTWYDELLSAELIEVSGDPEWGTSNCWLTTILFDEQLGTSVAKKVRESLEYGDIESRPVWKPMHRQPVFAGAEAHLNGTSDDLFARGLCLPSGVGMDRDEVERVANEIVKVLG